MISTNFSLSTVFFISLNLSSSFLVSLLFNTLLEIKSSIVNLLLDFKVFKAFALDLQLFLFVFRKAFLKENK